MRSEAFRRIVRALAPVVPIVSVLGISLSSAHAQQSTDMHAMPGMAMQMPTMDDSWPKARLNNSPRHLEWITVKYGNRTVKAFVAYPQVSEKAPVVLVIHEIFGLSNWARSEADELAEQGYIAVAPDLLSGLGPNGGDSDAFADQDARVKAVSGLDAKQVNADLNAVADYALKFPAANGKLAVIGFCWGGTKSFDFATQRKNLSAAFVFYGTPPDPAAIPSITAPVYGFYAGNDARVGATIPTAAQEMKSAGKKYEPVSYDGAGHGFMRAGEAPAASADDKKARDASMIRLEALLKAM